MNNQEAKEFINSVFDLIKKAKNVSDLEAIPSTLKIPDKNRMNTDKYPPIQFSINANDIRALIDEGIIGEDHNFVMDISSRLTDPLSKLLYAMAWKNGDLQKVKHIIKGILETNYKDDDQIDALVFYQFGKYLTKDSGQPIIDQHVFRAFLMYKLNENDNFEIEKLRKLNSINKNHKGKINDYKVWLKSNELTADLRNENDYSYHIDKLLFAVGKTIKTMNK